MKDSKMVVGMHPDINEKVEKGIKMYQENKDDLKQWLLSNITDLLVNEDTKPEERKSYLMQSMS